MDRQEVKFSFPLFMPNVLTTRIRGNELTVICESTTMNSWIPTQNASTDYRYSGLYFLWFYPIMTTQKWLLP
jgi:hypothetical protein